MTEKELIERIDGHIFQDMKKHGLLGGEIAGCTLPINDEEKEIVQNVIKTLEGDEYEFDLEEENGNLFLYVSYRIPKTPSEKILDIIGDAETIEELDRRMKANGYTPVYDLEEMKFFEDAMYEKERDNVRIVLDVKQGKIDIIFIDVEEGGEIK